MFLTSNCSDHEDAAETTHIGGLYSYAMILSRSPTEAEDLVQETYLHATRAVGRLRVGSNVKTWLFTILRNVWFNQLRYQRTRPRLIELDGDERIANLIAASSGNPHELYSAKVEHAQVREAIRKLPAKFRVVVLMREFEDLSYHEIARILNCPVGTVMSRLGRARAKLRSMLCEASQRGPRRNEGQALKLNQN
ncbi:MAG: polymerase, sigma-24 subunit, subfamily [Bryobacterales bacterium]|nr:polymerase, sigma-24 subunit, subfamily [Bryobacterales bacterium]